MILPWVAYRLPKGVYRSNTDLLQTRMWAPCGSSTSATRTWSARYLETEEQHVILTLHGNSTGNHHVINRLHRNSTKQRHVINMMHRIRTERYHVINMLHINNTKRHLVINMVHRNSAKWHHVINTLHGNKTKSKWSVRCLETKPKLVIKWTSWNRTTVNVNAFPKITKQWQEINPVLGNRKSRDQHLPRKKNTNYKCRYNASWKQSYKVTSHTKSLFPENNTSLCNQCEFCEKHFLDKRLNMFFL